MSILKQPQTAVVGSSSTTTFGVESVPKNGSYEEKLFGYVQVSEKPVKTGAVRRSRKIIGMIGHNTHFEHEVNDAPNILGVELAFQSARVGIHRWRAGKIVSGHLRNMRRMRQDVETIEL